MEETAKENLQNFSTDSMIQLEKALIKKRIRSWLSKSNLDRAMGKSRDEIFTIFGNLLEPIAIIDHKYLPYLGNDIKDYHVYSGRGYFIDHAVNNHPNIPTSEYENIQDILDYPDDVKLDSEKEKPSLIFVKKYSKYGVEVVRAEAVKSGNTIFHKTFFMQNKKPYANLRSIRSLFLPLVDGNPKGIPTISPADNPTAAVSRFSALNDNRKGTK
ncbi:MAG: hypothetical protein LBO71_03450 [Prevotellaceae bacterium]|jgi:hypothetical protein|nr:hypothetical protein [Prevotellaceae bacterium]